MKKKKYDFAPLDDYQVIVMDFITPSEAARKGNSIKGCLKAYLVRNKLDYVTKVERMECRVIIRRERVENE
jgi:hypothetical protein